MKNIINFIFVAFVLTGCSGQRFLNEQQKKSFSSHELQNIWEKESSQISSHNYDFPFGIKVETTQRILGKPNLVRDEKISLMSVHNSKICSLYLFFEKENQVFRLKHIESRDYNDNSKIDAIDCFRKIAALSYF